MGKKKINHEDSQFRQLTIWDVIQQFDRQSYTVKSLFSGAGGLDYGFEQAGLRVVESYEFEANACATLAKSGKANVYKCDISKLLLENQLRTYIITATFPCTHFSTAGLRDGDELYLEAHRIIRCLSPEVFVIENVPAMRRHAVVMEAFMEMPGYHVSQFVLNAADCGHRRIGSGLLSLAQRSLFCGIFRLYPKTEKPILSTSLKRMLTFRFPRVP